MNISKLVYYFYCKEVWTQKVNLMGTMRRIRGKEYGNTIKKTGEAQRAPCGGEDGLQRGTKEKKGTITYC